MNETQLREQMAMLASSLFDRGLTGGSSGNISARLDDGWLMSPTNASFGRLDPARIARLDADGNHIDGDSPTKETFLHMAMYSQRPQDGAIVHLHSTHAVAVSCLSDIDPTDCIPPLTPYFVMRIGRLPLVPYHMPGDKSLGDAVKKLAGKHSAVLLANHGPVVSGKSLEAAVYAIEELEETAKLFFLLRKEKTRTLTEQQIEALNQRFPRS